RPGGAGFGQRVHKQSLTNAGVTQGGMDARAKTRNCEALVPAAQHAVARDAAAVPQREVLIAARRYSRAQALGKGFRQRLGVKETGRFRVAGGGGEELRQGVGVCGCEGPDLGFSRCHGVLVSARLGGGRHGARIPSAVMTWSAMTSASTS